MWRASRTLETVIGFASSFCSAVISAVLPATCAGCGRVGDWFCDACSQRLVADVVDGCRRCGRQAESTNSCPRCEALFPTRLRRVRAGFVYEGVLRRAVQRFKYHGEYRRGRDLGERLLARTEIRHLIPAGDVDMVIPIPLHVRRLRMRGFNQAEILASAIAERTNAPITPALNRVRDTYPQVQLQAHQRQENMENAFLVEESHREAVSGARVILVDDVMTTGATIGSAAAALQQAGAREIYGLTLARDR
jgi:ComF family protein